MSVLRINKIFTILGAIAMLASACGSPQLDESAMSTAVAQTVQAQNTQEIKPTATSPALTNITDTPAPLASLPATVTSTPLTQGGAGLCTASASLVGETIPDGTIIQPGATFTKAWQVKNTGTCTWDSNWQLTFYGGDQLDGLAVYNFPEPAQPGQTLNIPIILRAPAGGGTYTGEWMLKSPWGESFGVGPYSVPISVSIVTASSTPENRRTETVYGVTAVTYQVDRRCDPANTVYTITAYITSNGPVDITFSWFQSDGNEALNNRLSFPEAMTKSVQREWIQHSTNSSPNQRWVKVVINTPTHQSFPEVVLPNLCGQQ